MAEEARTIGAEIGDNALGRAILETTISYEEFAQQGELRPPSGGHLAQSGKRHTPMTGASGSGQPRPLCRRHSSS